MRQCPPFFLSTPSRFEYRCEPRFPPPSRIYVLQLRRDPCPLDAKPGAWYSPPKVGDTVARGPKWPRGDMSDGGPGGLGTVMELTTSSMTVSACGGVRMLRYYEVNPVV